MKEFFRSTAFKCIAVLLSIALVCCGLLAILNEVLAVSTEERTSRAIKKIYGQVIENYEVVDIDKTIDVSEYGTIDTLFRIDNGENDYDLLFKSTGNNGYKNGTITLWIQVNVKNNVAKIEKTILEEYDKQTLMGKLSSYYSTFEYDENFYSTTGTDGTTKNVVSGATKSSNAANNAVNCVIKYVKEAIN